VQPCGDSDRAELGVPLFGAVAIQQDRTADVSSKQEAAAAGAARSSKQEAETPSVLCYQVKCHKM
jgi:hypothetical protein